MSEVSPVAAPQINWAQFASSAINELSDTLESMLENFGPEDMGQAMAKEHLSAFIDTLRTAINDTDELPQLMKDLANATLDSFANNLSESCPCSQEAADAVAGSDVGSDAANAGAADAESAVPATEAEIEAEEEASNEGGGMTASDVDNEITGGAGGKKNDEEEGKGNWLAILAGSLSDIQSQFLDDAMDARDAMVENQEEAGSGDSKAFLEAQGQYAANIQLFTIFSNQTSTTIKSIGEALAGISRKQ